jgi:hypothetical protein
MWIVRLPMNGRARGDLRFASWIVPWRPGGIKAVLSTASWLRLRSGRAES